MTDPQPLSNRLEARAEEYRTLARKHQEAGDPGSLDAARIYVTGGLAFDEAAQMAREQEARDLLPYLVRARAFPELAHAIHHAGGLLQLLERVTNTRWQPIEEERHD